MVKTKRKKPTQKDLLREYFKKHPNKDILHPKIVDWATREWKRRTNKIFRDPDRGIRSLYQEGFLIKIKKGCYRYDSNHIKNENFTDFTQSQKNEILKRDKYKCVICGHGKSEGLELHIDHIKPRERGGKSAPKNGQVLCSNHNMFKKTYSQTEMGKKLFIKLYRKSEEESDLKIFNFCYDILKLYEKHKIDTHISDLNLNRKRRRKVLC